MKIRTWIIEVGVLTESIRGNTTLKTAHDAQSTVSPSPNIPE
jgi:hypothetical protein